MNIVDLKDEIAVSYGYNDWRHVMLDENAKDIEKILNESWHQLSEYNKQVSWDRACKAQRVVCAEELRRDSVEAQDYIGIIYDSPDAEMEVF